MKLTLFFLTLLLSFSAQAQDCAGFPLVKGFSSDLSKSCLGLVADANDVPWVMPRKVSFLNENTLLVSDLGGWKDSQAGAVWAINTNDLSYTKIYSKGRFTHGLAIDIQSRILIGDADKILRLDGNKKTILIENLPTKGSHPLSHFILLPNNDLVLNIGAPSDNCKKEMGSGTHCPSRDTQGEIRYFYYLENSDSYDANYRVLARGLRNSMALLYNPILETLYQAENNLDQPGTPEEFNSIPLNSDTTLDFGWPFCYGFGEEAPSLNSSFASFCKKRSAPPLFLIPNHSSPLDMIYYQNSSFPEIENSILMTWHGHRRSQENSIVAYHLDNQFSPEVFSELNNSYVTVLSGLNKSTGDKIRPVGVTSASNGSILFIDDQTKRLYIIASSDSDFGDKDTGETFIEKNDKIVGALSSSQLEEFSSIYDQFQSVQTCTKCHDSREFPKKSKEALKQFLNKKWLSPGSHPHEMTLITRISPSPISPRSMPPAPEKPFGLEHPKIYQDLLNWVENNLSQ